MKKILIAAAIVCAAAYANAASVSWKVTGAKDATGASLANSTDYTFSVSVYLASNDSIVGTKSTDTAGSPFAQYDGTVDGVSANTSYYAILEASANGYALADSIANTKFYFTTDEEVTYSINLTSGAGLTSSGTGAWSASSWKATSAVPEPTSSILLLLGMAGLALRRKRA